MKKLIYLLLGSSLFLLSCTKKDSDEIITETPINQEVSIVGKWEFTKVSQEYSGVPVSLSYPHVTDCPKDFVEFNADKTGSRTKHDKKEATCVPEIQKTTYTLTGNKLTSTDPLIVGEAEITTLTATELTIKYTDRTVSFKRI
jgi:hypothetical protein